MLTLSGTRLCGFPPFAAEGLPQLLEKIITADFDYPSNYWDEVSAGGRNDLVPSSPLSFKNFSQRLCRQTSRVGSTK